MTAPKLVDRHETCNDRDTMKIKAYLNERSTVIVAKSGCIDFEVLLVDVTFYGRVIYVDHRQSALMNEHKSSPHSMESLA